MLSSHVKGLLASRQAIRDAVAAGQEKEGELKTASLELK